MKSFEQIKQEMLSITDPRQAYIAISTNQELDLLEMHEITMAYREKYGVGMEEMAFYPNGERVLKAEMFRDYEYIGNSDSEYIQLTLLDADK